MQIVTAQKSVEIQLRILKIQKKQGYNLQLEFFRRVPAESPFPPLSNNNTRKMRRLAEKDYPRLSTTPLLFVCRVTPAVAIPAPGESKNEIF